MKELLTVAAAPHCLLICCTCFYSGFVVVVVGVIAVAPVVVAQRDSCHNCARSSMVVGLQTNIYYMQRMHVLPVYIQLLLLMLVLLLLLYVAVCYLQRCCKLLFFCETIALLLEHAKTGNRLATFLTCKRPLLARLQMNSVFNFFFL